MLTRLPYVALTLTLSALMVVLAAPHAHAAAVCSFTRDLTLGIEGEDVRCLQKYLNASGYPIAATGVGSVGHETVEFKTLTEKAVKAWQTANGISPASGTFGPISRQKYAKVAGAGTASTTPTSGKTDAELQAELAALMKQAAALSGGTTNTTTTPPPATVSPTSASVQKTIKDTIDLIGDAEDQIGDAEDE
ncbi:MAG: peptidoglycan-binding domain-containing protein [Patescibacteria group bacterium]